MKLSRPTRFNLVPKGAITLSPADHIATGGEGSVYRKGDLVVKLYSDPLKMRRDGMEGKIRALVALSHPYMVAPQGLACEGTGSPAGYYMPYAPGEPLARVFTNDFRNRTGFGDRDAITLAARMLEVVDFAHSRQAIMADANELNWLMASSRSGPEPRVLDVDSWAIDRWPATAIMPSIRDWRSPGFGRESDYFAWGVVTFQLFTGIHPYKGTLAGYKPSDLERRMRDQKSVFASGIRLNRAVRPFSCIPRDLLDWYEAAFQRGIRSKPPVPRSGAAAASRTVRTGRVSVSPHGTLHYERLYDGKDPAVRIFPCGVILLQSGALWDISRQRVIGSAPAQDCEVISAPEGWLVAGIRNQGVQAEYINGTSLATTKLQLSARGTRLVRSINRLFLVTGSGLTELEVRLFGRPILAAGRTWGAQTQSTHWFDGVGVQDTLGATYVIAPFGTDSCAQVRVRELDGLKPVAAIAGPRFITVLGLNRQGEYRRIELAFDRFYSRYTASEVLADSGELNLTALPTGVVAAILMDGEIKISVPSNGTVKKVADRDIAADMTLAAVGERVVFLRGGQVWSVRM